MPDSILGSLWSLITPREAEAKVLGGKQELNMLGDVMRSNAAQQGQYLPDQYRRVMQAAQAHPQVVTLKASPGMMGERSPADPDQRRATAAYDAKGRRIFYDPGLPTEDKPNTIAHELVHFLNYQSQRPQGPEAQHALIRQFLGTDVYDPTTSLEGYLPPGPSAVEHNIWRKWLGGQPEAWEGGR